MKRLRISTTILLALSLILLTACSGKKYIPPLCASVEPVERVEDINVTTNSQGGLDHNNTVKVFSLIGKLRTKEYYYDTETGRLWRLNNGEL